MKTFLNRLIFAMFMLAWSAHAYAQADASRSAAALRAQYQNLQEKLRNNEFGRPVYLDSRQSADDVEGDIYSVINYPFRTTRSSLSQASNWCEILFLHLNTKYCKASQTDGGNSMTVYVGKKTPQSLDSAYRIDYQFRPVFSSAKYLQVLMSADSGPFGTSNYRIMLEAIPVGAGRSFIHVKYSYAYGTMAKLAMQSYLSTFGSGKVGFSSEANEDGEPTRVGGLRGAMERNTMRYYLAIDAYLQSLSAPEKDRLETRLRDWFRSTERYSLQLHEISQKEYLSMKRKEYQRQQAGEE